MKNIRVVVLKTRQYDGEWPPSDLLGFEKWFAEKRLSVPPVFWPSLVVELDTEPGYSETMYPTIEISYTRPETPEEAAERERERAERKAGQEQKERAEWLRLNAKFGERK